MIRIVALIAVLTCLSGCGGPVAVPAVMEYNAAVQAFDRELNLLEQAEASLKTSDPKSPKTKEFQSQVESQKKLVETLRTAKNNAKSRLP